ncbi:hypothetical protein BDZ97DRAFT_1661232 [Flammula alnicola]|nr:hypothetical protein BDZ97DRAFT_1661232 [Flammula alnicola]
MDFIRVSNALDKDSKKERRTQLSTEIANWRKTQVRALPQMEDFLANSNVIVEPETDVLFLPSDLEPELRQQLNLQSLVEIEYQLREGEANDAVALLCNTIMHAMVLLEEKNRHARGIYQNTRAMTVINGVKEKRRIAAARYRETRHRLLKLTGASQTTIEDFPELKDEDTYAKNSANARGIGDGKTIDSWIWTFGNLKGLNAVEKAEFLKEIEKVQWFRARADMERWIEEVELLEEEFRRFIRGCQKLQEIWTSLSLSVNDRYTYLPRSISGTSATPKPSPGHCAYALQKADMYSKMASTAQNKFKTVGGEWPLQGETLSEYVRRRRPCLTVDWTASIGLTRSVD